MLTKCPCVIWMSNAIVPQSLHQNIGVELSHKIHSNTEALSKQHRSGPLFIHNKPTDTLHWNNSTQVTYNRCYCCTHTSNFWCPRSVYMIGCSGREMTLWRDIDRKTWTLRLHTKLVSWYLWLHSNKEIVSHRKTEFTNFLYCASCTLKNLTA